jgi:hypothetical protein
LKEKIRNRLIGGVIDFDRDTFFVFLTMAIFASVAQKLWREEEIELAI